MVPKRIYLQYDPDGETTWCEEMINDDDIEYVIASELGKANAKIEILKAALESLRKKKHNECEDCWYSCPKSEDYCGEDRRDICTCGMDRINTIIDKALKAVSDD